MTVRSRGDMFGATRRRYLTSSRWSAEITAGDSAPGGPGDGHRDPERTQRVRDQVNDPAGPVRTASTAGPLDPAPDDQGRRHRGGRLVPFPHRRQADDVHHAGLVLQAEE